jgi:hypothetical protein
MAGSFWPSSLPAAHNGNRPPLLHNPVTLPYY